MTRLVWGPEAPIGRYLSAKFPHLMAPGLEYQPEKVVGFIDDDNLLFGAVGLRFENLWDAQLSIFVERPRFLTRSILAELFAKLFVEFGLVRVSCHIAKGNRHARQFVERLGWKLEGVKRRGFDGRLDACIYGMLATECRWLRKDDDAGA